MMWLARLVVRWNLCLRHAQSTEAFRQGFLHGCRAATDAAARTAIAYRREEEACTAHDKYCPRATIAASICSRISAVSPEQHYRHWLQG